MQNFNWLLRPIVYSSINPYSQRNCYSMWPYSTTRIEAHSELVDWGLALDPRGFLDNKLVYVTQHGCVYGLDHREPPTGMGLLSGGIQNIEIDVMGEQNSRLLRPVPTGWFSQDLQQNRW